MIKKFLISGVVALSAFAFAITVDAAFTRNLSVGSTGTDVAELQSWLISKGYSIPSISAGTAAPGYFGAQTKTAVMAYQAANGIPNTGFFGPLTMASVNAGGSMSGGVCPVGYNCAPTATTPVCPVGFVCTPVGGGAPIAGTVGVEGQLTDFDTLGDTESEVDEGSNDEMVLGVEFEAEDSDITIERVDVDFEMTTGDSNASSDRIDRYFSAVSLWLDGKKIADADSDDSSEDDDVYSFRFSGLNVKVMEGDVSELYVAVDVDGNVDSDDEGSTWTVTIPENGIRATDSAGISETYHSSEFTETFTVGAAEEGDIDLTEADENPDATDVEVDDTNDTSGITALVFELEANDTDMTVESISINIATTGATVSEIVKNAELYKGSSRIKTKNVTSSNDATGVVTFDNLDLDIDADDTETFTVKLTINDTEGNFGSGDSVTVTIDSTDIDAENAAGDSVDVSGSADGNTITLREIGASVSFLSASESVDTDASPDRATYTIKFSVTAFGDDVYLSATSTTNLSNAVTITNSNGFATASSSVLTSNATKVNSNGAYEVKDGQTKDFTLTVVNNGGGAFNYVSLTGVKFGTDSAGTLANTISLDASDFQTDPVFIGN